MRVFKRSRLFGLTAVGLATTWLSLACSERRADVTQSSPEGPQVAADAVPESQDSHVAIDHNDSPISLGAGRSIASASWDTLWQKRGTFDDTLLLQPLQLHAATSIVFVSDFGNNNVQAFDAKTGDRLWTAGRAGSGPREFSRMMLFSASDELLGVSDATNRRISFVSMQGEFVGEETVPFPSSERGICKLGERYFVAGSRDGKARVLKWTEGADTLELQRPEWLSYLDTLDLMIGQFSLRQVDDSHCAIAHSVGPLDLLIFDSTLTLTRRVAPRERVRPGRVDSTPKYGRIALSVASGSGYGWGHPAVASNSLFVTFRGSSPFRARLIEEFRLPDFTYVGTHLASYVLRGLAGAEDRLTLLMEDTSGYYVITQLRRREGRQE
jgi:hypothetical protein